MKISTRGRFALELMVDLALYNTGEPVKVSSISKRLNVSVKYLEQIIAILNRAGLVNSVRGAKGGYSLKNAPSEYTVGMILRETEGDLWPVNGLQPGEDIIDGTEQSITYRIWNQIYDSVNAVVDNITLEDMLEWHSLQADFYII